MRWQPVASSVVERLKSLGCLENLERRHFITASNNGDAVDAFHRMNQLMSDRGWRVGWNKILQGNVIRGWYGTMITSQPLRTVAFEISTDDQLLLCCREILNTLHQNKKPDLSEDQQGEAANLLQECGIDVLHAGIDRLGLALLLRLNLNQRELPFAERITWAGKSCLFQFSDGGRIQITRELVWARAIESAIDEDGKVSRQLRHILTQMGMESTEIVLP